MRIEPTCTVRSLNGRHQYFKVRDKETDTDLFNKTALKLASLFSADMRYINGNFFRIPGSLDIRNKENPFILYVEGGSGESYFLKDLLSV